MDPVLLRHYERELQHLREMGGEFAREFPKIAGRLGLEGFECADPYVERLLEGFAFMAARVQLRLDAEFPRFTQQLLELVYPHYLAPTPSMAVVQLQPDLAAGSLAAGFTVPRDSSLRSLPGRGEGGACEYRSAQPVTLWPLQLVQARYFRYGGEYGDAALPGIERVRAGIRLRLRSSAGLNFAQLPLESLRLHLRGSDALPMQLYELMMAHAVGLVAQAADGRGGLHAQPAAAALQRVGFDDAEALLPYGPRSFQGYRLLHEYFAFPQRYLFVELAGLAPAVRACRGNELDLVVLLDRSDPALERVVDAAHFALFCTPAVNLFPHRCDRIHLNDLRTEHQVIPDRTRPLDFEVHQLRRVTGYGTGPDSEREFQPLYAARDLGLPPAGAAYYQQRRVRRMLAERERRQGARTSYVGSEMYLALVDAQEAPAQTGMRQLAIEALCSNRDLPLSMPLGVGATDFTLESGAPVAAIRCVAGPSRPQPPHAEGEAAWRLISQLSLNYLSLVDAGRGAGNGGAGNAGGSTSGHAGADQAGSAGGSQGGSAAGSAAGSSGGNSGGSSGGNQHGHAGAGAQALRDLLRLYAWSDAALLRQIEGLRAVTATPVTRRLPVSGPITFGRGQQIALTLDEAAFEGSSAFLLGAVLEQFFAGYASINSFTETIVKSHTRGEIMRWPARVGRCRTL